MPFGHLHTSTGIDGLYLCGVSTLRYSVAGVTASGIDAARAALNCRSSDILTGKGSGPLFVEADGKAARPRGLSI